MGSESPLIINGCLHRRTKKRRRGLATRLFLSCQGAKNISSQGSPSHLQGLFKITQTWRGLMRSSQPSMHQGTVLIATIYFSTLAILNFCWKKKPRGVNVRRQVAWQAVVIAIFWVSRRSSAIAIQAVLVGSHSPREWIVE